MDTMEQRRPARLHAEHRLGLVGAAALVAVTVVGALAAASPVASPSVDVLVADALTAQVEWTDGFDHVVVTRAQRDEPVPDQPVPDEPVPDERVAEQLRAVEGVQRVTVVAPGIFAVATAGDREALLSVPGVVDVVDDLMLSPMDDPNQGQQWALSNTGDPSQSAGLAGVAGADANVVPAWGTATGTGVVVAVIDTGISTSHPDLAGQRWVNVDETCDNGVDDDGNTFVDDCAGWDFGMNDADPNFDASSASYDHGTHVAGIIAAGLNGVGVVGVAPGAKVMAVKASVSPSGGIPSSAVLGAVQYAVDNGADIINMSFGTAVGTTRSAASLLETAVQYAVDRGVLVVAAAGNSGADISSAYVFPAAFSLFYPGVIAVGSTTNTDTRSSFSNYGTPVNLYAPGSYLMSTIGTGGYGYKSGTSMATPMVAGGAAVLLSLNPTLAPAALRTALVGSARALGWGAPMLDVAAAVGAAPPVAPPAVPQVVYEGVDAMRANTASTVGVRVSAASLPAGVTGARLSLVTLDSGAIYAVEGLAVELATTAGTTNAVSGLDGSVPAVAFGSATAVSATEWYFTARVALPAGSYGLVTDLVDDAGVASGTSLVGFLQVNAAAVGTTTSTVSGATTTTVRATTTTGGAATTVSGATTTVRAATTTVGGVVTTVSGATTTVRATTTVGGVATTVSGATTTVRAATTTVGGVVTTVSGATTTVRAATTLPTVATTVATTTTVRATTSTAVPTTAAPTTTRVVVTTTPTPSTVVVGSYRIDSMTPRAGSMAGGSTITMNGAFPTTVPVYVWFGATAVAPATVSGSGSSLTVTLPQALTAGVVDVTVRFTTSQSYALVYSRAFTYTDPSAATPTTVAPGTTVAPATTVRPGTTVPGATTTTGASTSTTVAVRTRGAVRLRPVPPASSAARLLPANWPPTACTASSCPATAL
jgi:serine protease